MMNITKIYKTILLEQDSSKLMMIKKSITKRIPITIDYRGPSPEVKSGVRYDIEPVVLGTHFRSDNLVMWAYVFSGTSKKGLPDWKMFRIDRINSIKFSPSVKPFNVNELPGYQKGKAPNAMKSLGNVITFSPYWYDDRDEYKIGRPSQQKPEPELELEPQDEPDSTPFPQNEPTPQTEPTPQQTPEPEMDTSGADLNSLLQKTQDIDGQKSISSEEYEKSVRELYKQKEGTWKNDQRSISGNMSPGEGTRKRFDRESRIDLDNFLSQNNINVNNPDMLSETIKRIKFLIN